MIGRGAMGDIYRATDCALCRVVAVKVLADRYDDDIGIRQRFEREARTAATLSPAEYVITIFDVGEWHHRAYLVMEYADGGSLADRLAAGKPPLGLALRCLEQTARALDTAHRAGIVHRDVKPGNILLDRNDDVRVADFGIARAVGLDSLTTTGTVLGTAGYLAPEQARGEPATDASDRYALGVVAFELLTGSRPFERATPTAEALAHIREPVPSARTLQPELPPALDDVFARALSKDPAERYPSALDLAWAIRDAVRQSSAETAVLPPQTPGQAAPRPRKRWRRFVLIPALVAAALAGLSSGLLLSRGSPRIRTLTVRGKVIHETVTAPAPPPPPPAPQPPPPPAATPQPPAATPTNAHALNDRGYTLMKQGSWTAALPLLQAAVHGLTGAGPADPYEAYANYNLGYTLLRLGRCTEAIGYLHHADRLEPGNADVHAALGRATRC